VLGSRGGRREGRRKKLKLGDQLVRTCLDSFGGTRIHFETEWQAGKKRERALAGALGVTTRRRSEQSTGQLGRTGRCQNTRNSKEGEAEKFAVNLCSPITPIGLGHGSGKYKEKGGEK